MFTLLTLVPAMLVTGFIPVWLFFVGICPLGLFLLLCALSLLGRTMALLESLAKR